jgi:hypothetical protein
MLVAIVLVLVVMPLLVPVLVVVLVITLVLVSPRTRRTARTTTLADSPYQPPTGN